jgi:hypothetical protein
VRFSVQTPVPPKHNQTYKNEGEIKTFPDKQKLRKIMTTRSILQEMFKGVLQDEMKGH